MNDVSCPVPGMHNKPSIANGVRHTVMPSVQVAESTVRSQLRVAFGFSDLHCPSLIVRCLQYNEQRCTPTAHSERAPWPLKYLDASSTHEGGGPKSYVRATAWRQPPRTKRHQR